MNKRQRKKQAKKQAIKTGVYTPRNTFRSTMSIQSTLFDINDRKNQKKKNKRQVFKAHETRFAHQCQLKQHCLTLMTQKMKE